MIVMSLSSLTTDEMSFGGVDSVCQMLLKAILELKSENEYLIVGFNPADNLKKQGEEFEFSTTVKVKWYNERLNQGSILKRIVPNFILQNLVIKEKVTDFNPDILHVHVPSWLLFRYKNTKKIVTLHTYKKIGRLDFGWANNFVYEKLVMPICINHADYLTTVSKDILTLLGGIKKPVNFIPNPINALFYVVKRKPGNKIVLILPSRVIPRKRIHEALKIIKMLKKRYCGICLLIAGSYRLGDNYYTSLLDYIKREQLSENVQFLGLLSTKDMARYYAEVRLGIFMSEEETFGLAPLEMLAAGVPVVTTRVGAMKWFEVGFRDTGVKIISVGDCEACFNAVVDLIESNRTELPKAKEFLLSEFSTKKVIMQYSKLYDELK